MTTKIILLLLLVLTACGHSIHEGKIIDKYYQPARNYTYTTTMMVNKMTIIQTHTGYDDEDWIVLVQDVIDGDTITEEFYLSELQFNCMNIGDHFNDTIPCEKESDGNR